MSPGMGSQAPRSLQSLLSPPTEQKSKRDPVRRDEDPHPLLLS